MEITTRHISNFVQVTLCEENTLIHLGTLNEDERDDLAKTLINAAFELGPRHGNCEEWFSEMLRQCGIE